MLSGVTGVRDDIIVCVLRLMLMHIYNHLLAKLLEIISLASASYASL